MSPYQQPPIVSLSSENAIVLPTSRKLTGLGPAQFFMILSGCLFFAQGFSAYFVAEIFGKVAESLPPIQVICALIAWFSILMVDRTFSIFSFLKGRWTLVFIIASILYITIERAFFLAASPDEAKAPFQFLIGVVMMHLGWYVVRHEEFLRKIFTSLFYIIGISGVLALFETFAGSAMPWARGEMVNASVGEGAQGLEWFPVSYSYAALVPVVVAFLYLVSKPFRYARPSATAIWFCVLFGGLGVFAAASRSGILGLLVGLFVARSLFRTKKSKLERWIGTLLLLLPFGLLGAYFIFDSVGKGSIFDDPRLYSTYMVYVPVVVTNPFGVGESALGNFRTFADAYAELDFSMDINTFKLGYSIAPHNAFLTAGTRYGWFGLFGLIALYWLVFRARKLFVRHQGVWLPEAVLGAALVSSQAALVTHAWFHNMSIFTGDMRNWLPIGMIFGLQSVIERGYKYRGN